MCKMLKQLILTLILIETNTSCFYYDTVPFTGHLLALRIFYEVKGEP